MLTNIGRDNVNIRQAARLVRDPAERRASGLFVVEGERLCMEALRAGCAPRVMFCTETAAKKYARAAAELSSAAQAAYLIHDSSAAFISDTKNPQGIFCICNMAANASQTIDERGVYIALDRVQDPGNFGGAARTAEAFGLSGIIAADGCDRFSPKALRASMGSLLRLPVFTPPDMAEYLSELSGRGLRVCASVPAADAAPIDELDLRDGAVAVIGNEGSGISAAVLAVCDTRFTIPMAGPTESLNAAAAAAVIMWEFSGRARKGRKPC